MHLVFFLVYEVFNAKQQIKFHLGITFFEKVKPSGRICFHY